VRLQHQVSAVIWILSAVPFELACQWRPEYSPRVCGSTCPAHAELNSRRPGLFWSRNDSAGCLGLSQRLDIALDAARGMRHLASLGLVHRDLAARNVLVDSAYTAKVADFGLSRRTDNDYYRSSVGGALPLRWTGIEVLMATTEERR